MNGRKKRINSAELFRIWSSFIVWLFARVKFSKGKILAGLLAKSVQQWIIIHGHKLEFGVTFRAFHKQWSTIRTLSFAFGHFHALMGQNFVHFRQICIAISGLKRERQTIYSRKTQGLKQKLTRVEIRSYFLFTSNIQQMEILIFQHVYVSSL